MLKYIIAVTKYRKLPIVLECETDEHEITPDVAYIEGFDNWYTDKEEYSNKYTGEFDSDRLMSESGIYEVEGYDNSMVTTEGYNDRYTVTKVVKLSDLSY